MKPEKKTEVVVAAKNELATEAPPAPRTTVTADIVVPRLLLMQGTSDFVKDRKAQLGDMVRSVGPVKLGDPEHPVDFIPLTDPVPTWIVETRAVGQQRWTFKRVEPRTAMNDTLPWSFKADKEGKLLPDDAKSDFEWRRVKCLTGFVILPADIDAFQVELKKSEAGEMPDISKALTPILISFRSTSFKAGKEVSTFFTQVQQFKQKAHNFMLKLGCFLDKNDQGTYYVFSVDRSKPVPVKPEHKESVAYWAELTNTQGASLKVDEAGDEGEQIGGAGGGNF